MSDLKKSGPPPLPKDALKSPTKDMRQEAMPSPWDNEVVASSPPPLPTSKGSMGVSGPEWMGKPILHPSHKDELEMAAAVNEFGKKMPRSQAEQAAYGDYVKKNRISAAAHHLSGMKAANATGDLESARKHGIMYNLHSKALGHEAVGPIHSDVAAHLNDNPSKVYKFKSHKGDLYALDPYRSPEGIESSTAPIQKREALYNIWLACQELNKRNK